MPEIGMLSWPTIFVDAELRKLLGKRQPVAIYHTGNVRWSALADQAGV
jgi:hypothetical protein